MKTVVFFALALSLLSGSLIAEERDVVVPDDDKPFTVQQTEIVRLVGKGIAGSEIVAKVDGPAKIVATNNLRELMGGQNKIGESVKEFELKLSGVGKVTVIITVTSPIPDSKLVITTFIFTVR